MLVLTLPTVNQDQFLDLHQHVIPTEFSYTSVFRKLYSQILRDLTIISRRRIIFTWYFPGAPNTMFFSDFFK